MKLIFFILTFLISSCLNKGVAQQQKTMNSAELLHELEKIQVCASVLYIAAHPDDENTRLLTYLANERKYRTGYLSLTRGDGGQNLIGDEQGIELGLIRTQELLAARKIDGAEQFFTTAFDFGFSKTSDETFAIWNKEKILADVVWVIRKFKPDVIIARFPEDARAGHGHHAASGILAREAFYAAADATKYPEQLKQGVQVWQAKRVVWNTFNFGGNSTINDSQLKIDVGQYNPLLGKSYGEIAAQSRSQHRSQGFGVPSQRGSQLEFFTLIAGDSMTKDVMDGVDVSWKRYVKEDSNGWKKTINQKSNEEIKLIEHSLYLATTFFNYRKPEENITTLVNIFKYIKNCTSITDKAYFLEKLQTIIFGCAGLYVEASTTKPMAYQGDSLKINFSINARLVDSILLKNVFYKQRKFDITNTLTKNKNFNTSKTFLLANDEKLTQPYWLVNPMEKGRFVVNDQQKIGYADSDDEKVQFVYEILGELFVADKQLQYKYTDPVKGELFQPLRIVPNVDIAVNPDVIINTPKQSNVFEVLINPKKDYGVATYNLIGDTRICDTAYTDYVYKDSLRKGIQKSFVITNHNFKKPACGGSLQYSFQGKIENILASNHLKTIEYDHIPTIHYLQKPVVKFVTENIITNSKTIGYINGAGDKVAKALKQLGYKVDILQQADITVENLKKYDAIVTGVRTYNTNAWMNDVYDVLMQYINEGGNLITQFNTSNQIGPVKAKIAPLPFTISRNRITQEDAKVSFVNPNDVVLNSPNKITEKDFEHWVQERSTYEATDAHNAYRKVFTMNDDKEKPTDGSLIIAPYGKGNFVYCSLALFRQLPAGVVGAYKLIANLVELPRNKN